ncbi:MAG TPA: nuclear transport factor 2 family protein [Candidatus Dormibacteraeota bacterium]|jgi:ketosteroid isomerase-like protein|nr:nuclear transport factor 2 family protein [Candidatus Dormibacteraeota bacterium]
MKHPNIDLVERLYAAYLSGSREAIAAACSPDVQWNMSGYGEGSGTVIGIPAVLDYLYADKHMDDYAVEVSDMLASDTQVAVVARSSGRRGQRTIVNDYVQLFTLEGSRIVSVHTYNWDQRGLAEFMAVPTELVS